MTKQVLKNTTLCIKCRAPIEGRKCNSCGHWNVSETSGFELVTLDEVKDETVDRLDCGEWGYCWGSGIAVATTSLIGGFPGAGKSTLLLHLIDALACKTIYIATEEKLIRIRQRAERLGMSRERQKATTMVKMSTGEVPDISVLVKTHQLLVLDSLNMLTEDALMAVAFCKTLAGLCDRFGVTCIVTSHVTKGGEIAGFEALQHVVDWTGSMYPDEEEPGVPRVLLVEKNRNGMAFVSQSYAMTSGGLVILSNDGPTELEESETEEETEQ